jgi:hypothetical protein
MRQGERPGITSRIHTRHDSEITVRQQQFLREMQSQCRLLRTWQSAVLKKMTWQLIFTTAVRTW